MATRKDTVDFILGQISGAGDVSTRKMFGEYAIYCDGRTVALVCDDQLYVKPTEAGRAFVGECEEGPLFPGSKNYLIIPESRCLDSRWITRLIRITTAEVPLPMKKAKKARPVKRA